MKTFDFVLDCKEIGDTGEFDGYASTFGNIDQGGDFVEPGAFIESVVKAKKDRRLIPMLWQHDQHEPIGTWTDIAEDATGLYVKGRLILENNPPAKRAHSLLKAKALGGLSIGYRIPAGGAEFDDKRRAQRLKTIDLREVSLVTMPMNLEARVSSVKAAIAAGALPTVREFEEFLRDAGFPKSLAAAAACKVAPLLRGEPEPQAIDPASFLRALNPT